MITDTVQMAFVLGLLIGFAAGVFVMWRNRPKRQPVKRKQGQPQEQVRGHYVFVPDKPKRRW
jgi:hypothetical protein